MTIAAGTRLRHYEVLSSLGAGGMGEVYLAKDTRLDRKVALKLLPAHLTSDVDRVRRFEQEAQAASALNHPNIITIYEIGQADGLHFMATEFIEGKTLRQGLGGERLKLSAALEVAMQIASALAAAHTSRIIHRDIKPENVMLRPDGLVKVLDFGLAKLTERHTAEVSTNAPTVAGVNTDPGTVMGTVSYMSPEQARGLKVDTRSDIFSLGIVLYEMIAGRVPFDGVNALEVISAILQKEPAPLATPTTDVPAELQRMVSKTLRKDREARYQTAKDLLNDLKDLKEELSFAAKQAGAGQTEKHEAVTAAADAVPTVAGAAVPTTSSAKIIIGEIQRHKLGVALVLVMLLAVLAALSSWAFFASRTSGPIESIAVMPFVNASGNAEVEYLSDGMTETLISSLSQLPNLNVKARSSVFRYKGKEFDVQKIARELKVQAILNGRVMQRGEQLTLSLELINAQTENVIWTDQYDRKSPDLVSLQNEIARDVSSKLRIKLSGAAEQHLAKSYTSDPEAYRLYLQGRFYLNKRVGKLFDRAEGYFKQAIEKDPNFALGYAGLAEFIKERDRPKAKEYILRALALDNQLSDAHANLGYQLMLDYDFAASERELKQAIELDRNNAQAHQWNGSRLLWLGRYDESRASYERAIEIEPTLAEIRNNLSACLIASGKIEEGIDRLKQSIEMDPTFAWSHSHLSFVYRMKGDLAASVEERARAAELLDQPENAKRLRETFARNGWTAYVREHLRQNWGSLGISLTRKASLLAELGEKEEAMASLTSAAATGDWWLFSIKYDPAFGLLRDEPRFQELLKKFSPPQ